MPGITRSVSTGSLPVIASNTAPLLPRTSSAPHLAHSRASKTAPAQSTAPSQQVSRMQGLTPALSIDRIVDHLLRTLGDAGIATLRRLDKAHRAAIHTWARSLSFDALVHTGASLPEIKQWARARMEDVFRVPLEPRAIRHASHGRDVLNAIAQKAAHLGLNSDRGAGLVPRPDSAHAGWADCFQGLAVRALPDAQLPAYLDAADAAYGPQAGHLFLTPEKYASSNADALLPLAVVANKPLTVTSLLDRKPSGSGVLQAASDLLNDCAQRRSDGGGGAVARLDILQQLIQHDDVVLMLTALDGTDFPHVVLSQAAPASERANVRARQLALVEQMKAYFAGAQEHGGDDMMFDAAALRTVFIQAAQPEHESDPAVRQLNDVILRALA